MRSHRFIWTTCLVVACGGATIDAAELQPRTVTAWNAYVAATERRIAHELAAEDGFLVQDFHDATAAARRAVLAGRILVDRLRSRRQTGETIGVHKGAIHHWRGSIFLPRLTLDDVLHGVQSPLRQEDLQEDVIESRVLERDADGCVCFSSSSARSSSPCTSIQSTKCDTRATTPGGPRAAASRRRSPSWRMPGRRRSARSRSAIDRGFPWRLNSYWRYEAVDGGVIVECESITLSRSIPSLVRWMVTPMINSAARESMARTLTSMKTRLLAGVRTPQRTARADSQ